MQVPAPKNKSVVIIGAGVIGVASAHFLLDSGWDVTIIDKGRFAGACSHGNCGLICPSHVLPLAEPGAIKSALKAMFQRNSPFLVKPRPSLDLLTWLFTFARRCNQKCMIDSARGIQALLHSSAALYPKLIEQHNLDCEWETRGLLFAYKDPDQFEAFTPTNHLLTETFHEPATRHTGDELQQLEPAL